MNNPAFAAQGECTHPDVQEWHYQSDGKPVNLWSCVRCMRKFVPLDIEMENDAKQYREMIAKEKV